MVRVEVGRGIRSKGTERYRKGASEATQQLQLLQLRPALRPARRAGTAALPLAARPRLQALSLYCAGLW